MVFVWPHSPSPTKIPCPHPHHTLQTLLKDRVFQTHPPKAFERQNAWSKSYGLIQSGEMCQCECNDDYRYVTCDEVFLTFLLISSSCECVRTMVCTLRSGQRSSRGPRWRLMITPLPQKAVRAVKRVRVERERKRKALLTGTRQWCVNISQLFFGFIFHIFLSMSLSAHVMQILTLLTLWWSMRRRKVKEETKNVPEDMETKPCLYRG